MSAERLEELLGKLEALPDPGARELAREAVRAVLDLHAAGLARALAVASGAGAAGQAVVEAYARDPLVGNLLLLHGLHPHELGERVRAGLARAAAALSGAAVELLSVEQGVAVVRLLASGCGAAQARASVEQALLEAAPDLARVEFAEPAAPGFVPLSRLTGAAAEGG